METGQDQGILNMYLTHIADKYYHSGNSHFHTTSMLDYHILHISKDTLCILHLFIHIRLCIAVLLRECIKLLLFHKQDIILLLVTDKTQASKFSIFQHSCRRHNYLCMAYSIRRPDWVRDGSNRRMCIRCID